MSTRIYRTKIEVGMSERVALTIFREILLDHSNEWEFNTATLELAQWYGWKVLHIRPVKVVGGYETPVQGDGKGFPDLFMLHEAKSQRVAAELKIGENSESREQLEWLSAMKRCGIAAYTWWPKDVEEILQVLKSGPSR